MENSSVSFGSTKIFYSASKKPINYYVDKIRNNSQNAFNSVKGYGTVEQAKKALKPGQVAVVAEKDALVIRGQNQKEDKLIYNIVTDNGKAKLPEVSYADDVLDIMG